VRQFTTRAAAVTLFWNVNGRERRRPVVASRGRDWIVVGESTLYYGKQRLAPGRWKTVKLFIDRVASERRLAKLQAEYDQRAAAGGGEDVETLQKPIAELRDEYIATEGKNADHVRISEFMLDKLIELGGWRHFRHITRDSIERILLRLAAQGKPSATATSLSSKRRPSCIIFCQMVGAIGCGSSSGFLKRVRSARGRGPAPPPSSS
jgi:hypothetical protein